MSVAAAKVLRLPSLTGSSVGKTIHVVTRRLPALVLLFVAAGTVGCGSHRASPAVRACVKRWNGSIARTRTLVGIVSGTEANVRAVGGRCVVTLMREGAKQRAFVFDTGHPQGIGGFLLAGVASREELPASQRRANAAVHGEEFALELKR
jgi:hypothetical protein